MTDRLDCTCSDCQEEHGCEGCVACEADEDLPPVGATDPEPSVGQSGGKTFTEEWLEQGDVNVWEKYKKDD